MNIRLAFSTCPNDTFAFYAMVFGKIDTRGFSFDLKLGDIQELNQWALEEEVDMIKVSSNAIGLLHPNYYLLASGGALGRGCGPLWVCKKGNQALASQEGTVAIPGAFTTANLLLTFHAPHLQTKQAQLFSDILDSVEQGKVASGLLIHEQRFTYATHEVECIQDLGAYWEAQTGLPIPLGSILVHKKMTLRQVRDLEAVLKESIQWAFDHPEETMPFVRHYAQEMEDEVMRAHINLYVNAYSLDMGEEGQRALEKLLSTGVQAGLYPQPPTVSTIMGLSPA